MKKGPMSTNMVNNLNDLLKLVIVMGLIVYCVFAIPNLNNNILRNFENLLVRILLFNIKAN